MGKLPIDMIIAVSLTLTACAGPNLDVQSSKAGRVAPVISATVSHNSAPTSPTKPPPHSPVDLTELNWADAWYPLPCFDDPVTVVRVHNYKGTKHGYGVQVSQPQFGVIGSGAAAVPVAALTGECTGASSSPDSLLVYAATPKGARLLGYALQPADNVYVQSITFEEGTMSVMAVGYSANAAHCCPDLNAFSDYAVGKAGVITRIDARTEAIQQDLNNSQVAVRQFACSSAEQAQLAIQQIRLQIQAVSGGSVEGVPTFSEGEYFNNYSQIGPLQRQLFALQRQLPQLRQECASR